MRQYSGRFNDTAPSIAPTQWISQTLVRRYRNAHVKPKGQLPWQNSIHRKSINNWTRPSRRFWKNAQQTNSWQRSHRARFVENLLNEFGFHRKTDQSAANLSRAPASSGPTR